MIIPYKAGSRITADERRIFALFCLIIAAVSFQIRKPTDVEGKKRVCVVGGGVGCAIAYPSAKAFKEAGVEVDVIIGFRNKDIVILEDEFKAACDHLYLMTDDGSYGEHGFVTVKLQQLLEAGTQYDEVLAFGTSIAPTL